VVTAQKKLLSWTPILGNLVQAPRPAYVMGGSTKKIIKSEFGE
jgi:hypothetical protein